jgi:hypothetical protein
MHELSGDYAVTASNPGLIMTIFRSPYINQAIPSLASQIVRKASSIKPYVGPDLNERSRRRNRVRVAMPKQLYSLEIEALARTFEEAVLLGLGYRVRRGKLRQWRQALRACLGRRLDVSWPDGTTTRRGRQVPLLAVTA